MQPFSLISMVQIDPACWKIMPKIVSDPVPDPNAGSGILHPAPRAINQAIFIYKCIKAAIFIDFIGTNLSGMKEMNSGNYAGPRAGTCIRFWYLSDSVTLHPERKTRLFL